MNHLNLAERVAVYAIIGAVVQDVFLRFLPDPFSVGHLFLFPLCIVGGVALWRIPSWAEFLFWAGCAAGVQLLLQQERVVELSSGL